jgi:hypothetical protein
VDALLDGPPTIPIDWTVMDQVLTGERPVRLDEAKVDCGVYCSKGLPQWLWIVDSLGFQPIWCLLAAAAAGELEWLRKVYPKIVFTTDLQYCRPVVAVFCDARPLGIATTWVELQLMFCLQPSSRVPPGWMTCSALFSHSDAGGCTDSSQRVHCMARSGSLYERQLPPKVIPGCVYTIASDTVDSGRQAPPPTHRRLPSCALLKVGKSVYHGGGLYPTGLQEHPIFLLPSVLSSSGWCRRRLTLEETWGVYDVPHRVVELLADRPVSQAWTDSRKLLPGRCLEFGVRQLLSGLQGKIEGGRILFSRSTRKRQRVEMEKNLERKQEKQEKSFSLESKRMKREMVLASIPEASDESSEESDSNMEDLHAQVTGLELQERDQLRAAMRRGARQSADQSTCETPKRVEKESNRDELNKLKKNQESADQSTCGITQRVEKESNRDELNKLKKNQVELDTLDALEACAQAETSRGKVVDELKATKADDARVRVEEWDSELAKVTGVGEGEELTQAAEVIRVFCLRWWRRRLTRSFFCWLHQKPKYQGVGLDDMSHVVEIIQANTPGEQEKIYRWAPLGRAVYCDWWSERDARHFKDLKAAREVAERSSRATWFEWTDGSAPVHWRWPAWYQPIARDGLPVWFREAPKQWRRPQPPGSTSQIHSLMKSKLEKVRERRYVQGSSEIQSLISFFAVPKGEDDVRMVYDGTKSGLNDCIWVPRFPLPTVGTHLRAVEPGTFMGDMDVGEMFLNFVLHESMQALCGIDLTEFFGDDAEQNGEPKLLWERWVRAAMGLKSSPYQAVQGMLVVKEVILGDRRDPDNVFRWDKIRMNLPGSETYDPSLPWVSKVRIEDGKIAADLFIYVDDVRLTGSSSKECREAGRRAASVANSLGIQDAARKRRFGSQRPGAWAGSVVETSHEGVFVTVSQEKWDKCKRYIGDIIEELNRTQQLNHKELEKKRGFLIYVTRTYPAMVPFLKGIHQTLEMWRPNRDEDGWKIVRPASQKVAVEHGDPPKFVCAAPRLASDMEALQLLFSSVAPPRRKIRGAVVIEVFYGFGDASKTGFCTNFEIDGEIKYRYGHWCDETSEESSNYRELKNLVDGLEQQIKTGRIDGAEVFLFTDNSTAEAVYYKGNSSSRKLFDLMLRLRKLEMDASLILHVIHVSGTRMIAEGGDGGSRGDLTQGVMAGRPILDYIPLHLSALEREPNLEAWVRSWWNEDQGPLTTLRPEGWFEEGQQDGNFLWVPPPAAADVVVEQLGEARHKRPNCMHITIVPRLMTSRWRKGLLKESDLEIVIPVGSRVWGKHLHEPLLMFISFPLCRHPPWSLRGTNYLESFCRKLRGMWEALPDGTGPFLRELLECTRSFQSMPEGLVRPMLSGHHWRPLSDSSSDGRGRIRKRDRNRRG